MLYPILFNNKVNYSTEQDTKTVLSVCPKRRCLFGYIEYRISNPISDISKRHRLFGHIYIFHMTVCMTVNPKNKILTYVNVFVCRFLYVFLCFVLICKASIGLDARIYHSRIGVINEVVLNG